MSGLAGYAVDLHKKNTNQLGFIPSSRVDLYGEAGQIIPEYENGELCGYLIWGVGWPWFRIYQACVQYDARWLAHGRCLVSRAVIQATELRVKAITLRCRESNAAIEFWKALGFTVFRVVPGGKRRGENVCVFVYWLNDMLGADV